MAETPSIRVEKNAAATVVHVLVTDLDENHIVLLCRELADVVKDEPSLPCILDMSAVKFIPSLTLGALVRLVNEFRSRRQRLIFVNLQATVRKVIAITRMDRVMEILDDIPTALQSVGQIG